MRIFSSLRNIGLKSNKSVDLPELEPKKWEPAKLVSLSPPEYLVKNWLETGKYIPIKPTIGSSTSLIFFEGSALRINDRIQLDICVVLIKKNPGHWVLGSVNVSNSFDSAYIKYAESSLKNNNLGLGSHNKADQLLKSHGINALHTHSYLYLTKDDCIQLGINPGFIESWASCHF